MSANPLSCQMCGAALDVPVGRSVVECPYCGHTQQIDDAARVQAVDSALTAELMRGYAKTVGQASRRGCAEMKKLDYREPERGLWPVDGKASTSAGSSHGSASIVGRPVAYPLGGERPGTWQPHDAMSDSEWIEARYPVDAPRVSKIRVFEIQYPGATYAVTVRDRPGGAQELVWQAAPNKVPDGEPMVLEIPVDPPRRLHAVRAYVDNAGARRTAIDTIGLVAVEPLPEKTRTSWPKQRRRVPRSLIGVGLFLLGIWGLGRWCDSMSGPPDRPAPSRHVMAYTVADHAGLAELATYKAVWATHATASSERGSDGYAAKQVTGPPDVYPRYADDAKSWASHGADDGKESLIVSWDEPVSTESLIVVETFGPGSLIEADDLSGPRPKTLWRGTEPVEQKARLFEISWGGRRSISRVRLIFDTKRVSGWSEIDAVGVTIPQW